MTSAKSLRKPRVEYSEEIAEEILGKIADGEFLTRICSDPRYPYREPLPAPPPGGPPPGPPALGPAPGELPPPSIPPVAPEAGEQ